MQQTEENGTRNAMTLIEQQKRNDQFYSKENEDKGQVWLPDNENDLPSKKKIAAPKPPEFKKSENVVKQEVYFGYI